ncbi:uncharacterized protein [Haliotis cracherodii]|uniref:uncharacterized protein n=1 Tax=Haliotis cracherodii TaxID=6455 RepID=UPI0039E72DAF
MQAKWLFIAVLGVVLGSAVGVACTSSLDTADQSTNTSHVKRLHLIFMNHLDVGYNGIFPTLGFVNNVINRYFTVYFPRAVNVSRQLRSEGYFERLVYTTHPWLVSLYLDCPPNLNLSGIVLQCPGEDAVSDFVAAAQRGDISWHAGPMNMQFEMLDTAMVEFGLQLGQDLDKRLGIVRKFPTVSQRDVPGMTQALLPLLVQHGIAAVSVGVNPMSAPPAVPKIFRWEFQGASVIGMWNPFGYPQNPGPNPANPGGLSADNCVIFPGLADAMCFAFRTDNSGPPETVKEVLSNFEISRAIFPNAEVQGSTFEAFVEAAQSVKAQLPVVTKEIGDTWIQGAGSDPRKVAEMRVFLRARTNCLAKKVCSLSDPAFYNSSRFLLKMGEHTCGLSSVFDQFNWTNVRFINAMKLKDQHFLDGISSWVEQRQFAYTALDTLDVNPLMAEVKSEWDMLKASKPNLAGYSKLSDPTSIQSCENGYKFGFRADGALSTLSDPYTKLNWASKTNPLGQLVYQTYNQTDFDNFFTTYQPGVSWLGIGKPNMTNNSDAESRVWPTQLIDVYRIAGSACSFHAHIRMSGGKAFEYYGAPSEVWVSYVTEDFALPPGLHIDVQWFDKTPTRLPEALFFAFQPLKQEAYSWQLHKLGHIIDPLNVVLNGSQRQHAIDKGVFYRSATNQGMEIVSPDAAIVTVLTDADPISAIPLPLTPIKDINGMAFQLFNNIWDVNFIFWYPYTKEDMKTGSKFRFALNFLDGN